MKQTISSPIRKLKLLMVLPLIAGVFYAFAAPEYKVIQCSNNTETQQVIPEGKTVTGKVVTEDGKALKGASVIISGTTIGTITDANGSFKLIMTDNSPIVVSFVGFQSKKVQPDFEKPMDIKLDAVMINLDKVTVVGYGNTPPPPPPFDKKNPPLFMLDGKSIEESEMDKISPDKIESIDVLKGESAKATYGEKGKNGVILIKTKKNSTSSGKESGTNLNGNFVITPSKDNAQSTSGLNFTAKNIQGDFKNGTTEIKGDSIFADFSKTNSLLFIDGKEATKAEVNRLNPDKIESVNVLKDDFAVKKYGEKGKNGAIEITLKKTDSVSPPPPPSGKDNSVRNDKPIFIIVEEIPEYPGGTNALRDFIAKHVKYPAEAQKDKAQGTVYVNFVVTSNGKIGDTKVIRSVHPALDQEAIRVIKSLPDWKPGYQRGKAVDVAFTFPIDFILQ